MDSDEDDEMAELFSFGADSAPPSESETAKSASNPAVETKNKAAEDSLDDIMETADDSFMQLLDSEQPLSGENHGDANNNKDAMNDKETQDILNWLEEDDTDADAFLAAVADETAQKTKELQLQRTKSQEEKAAKEEKPAPLPPPPPPPVFESLKEALKSTEATKVHLLEHWEQKENSTLQDPSLRPLLWSRVICGKSIDELTSSSLADSFQEFSPDKKNEALQQWVRTEAAKLAPRIVRVSPISTTSLEDAEEALRSILLYQIHNNNNSSATDKNTDEQEETEGNNTDEAWFDPLLPPVICAILSAGIPKLATPVLMSHLMPSFMPFLALSPEERWEASKMLHQQFYLLACYHLPMLVYHLDRYVPGWFWPERVARKKDSSDEKENEQEEESATQKSRHLKDQGIIPPSWLMTHLAGECNGIFLEPGRLLQLWDLVFTNENNSLRFFLVLAILEQHSDQWLELTGEELVKSINERMQGSDTFSMKDWAARAKALKQATPESVVDRLRTAEDEAVNLALKERQKKAEAALKARLEAEAKAHQEAQERKAEEARNRLTRARLVAFYRRFNPSKEANVDKIMETYRDQFDELDKKLKKKYGVGFNPALNPNRKKKTMTEAANESMKKTMKSMNQGMEDMKKKLSSAKLVRKNPLEDDEDTDEIRKREHRVSVTVKVGETLPFFCMSREQANDIRRVCLQKDLPMPLRFYLVDSRPDEVAEHQGRFPTAAQLSPETLMDPELLQKYEDSFEGVRGSYHICVMGEGQSAIPALYNHRLTPELEEYMREDESRTNNVALFFIKRGFPFVSVLEGGFASAHAWLWREGRKKGFDANSILVDYHPETSIFGQMEQLRLQQKEQTNYSSREKTQRALQNLIEGSMTQLVKGKMKLEESLASEAEVTVAETGATLSSGTSAPEKPDQVQRKAITDSTGGGFKNLFSRGGTTESAPSLFGKKPASKRNINDEDVPKDSKPEETSEAPSGTPAPVAAQAQNRFSNWRQAAVNAIHQPSQQESSQPQQGNRFGGFGLGGFQRSASKEDNKAPPVQNMLKRNPFARFGGGGGAPTKPAEAPRFAGLMNKVSKPTFGRSGSATAKKVSNEASASVDTEPNPAPTIVAIPPEPSSSAAAEPEESVDFVTGSENSEEGGDNNTPATSGTEDSSK